MKKIFALGWMLVAALTLTNCSKEETATPELEGQAFEIFANANGSRTTMADLKTSWQDGDAMNVWTATTEGYQSHGQFTISDVENGKFTGTLDASFDNTTANDWYVMYPYNSSIKLPDGSNYMYVGHTAPKQNGNNSQAHLSGSSAPLYGVATAVAGSETPVFQMHHLSTFVRVRVTNNTAKPFSVASVYMTSESELYLVGSYYVNITGDEVVYTPSGGTYTKTEVTLTVNNGEEIAVGEQAEFYLPLAPIQFGQADEMLTLDIKTVEGATISVEKTIPAGTKFAAGVMNTLKVEATEDNIEYPEVETATWTLLTDPSEMTDGQYIIVAQNGGAASYLPSTTTPSYAPKYTPTELFDLTSRTIEISSIDAMVWNFAQNDGVWTITNNEGAYLYCTDTNNGIRIGATEDAWVIDSYPDSKTTFRFKNDDLARYVGFYNAQDWRCYSTYNHSNYGTSSQIYLYYKGTVVAKTALATPANLTATVQNETDVVVSWDAVENAGSYIVTCGANTATVTDATTYTFTDLDESTTYSVSVVAVPSNTETYKDSDAATTTVKTGGAMNYATLYTSNVELTTTGATKGSTASVTIDGQKYTALKAGTSSVAGSIVVTVPAGTTKLHYHVVGWGGKTTKITVTKGSETLASHSVRAESGVAGSSTDYTISTEAGDYYTIDLTDITEATAITFAATLEKRFVIWGVNAQ
ncbi:MAG: fimbrillin family protein [Alistipes sp.]|nr:fimbrillin family protein [Alistipes sp.]